MKCRPLRLIQRANTPKGGAPLNPNKEGTGATPANETCDRTSIVY
ncbi:hypothetical protein NYA9BBAC_00678 [Salinibacterium sp. NYA9b]